MLKAMFAVIGAVVLLVAIVIVRTPRPYSASGEPFEPRQFDNEAAVARFSRALQIQTVSPQPPQAAKAEPFIAFRELLEELYPHVHGTLNRRIVSDYSLLYHWQGSLQDAKGVMFAAHMDVVPVADAEEWTYPPFGGVIADGFVWGRGAMDDKADLLNLLEAVESLVVAGYRPQRDLYFAFGHDEEVWGYRGAAQVAQLLADEGVKLEFVLDEGMAIVDGILPGTKHPVALIGVAEKGFANVELAAASPGGHSAIPARTTASSLVASAAAAVQNADMSVHFGAPMAPALSMLAPHTGIPERVIFSNLWLFGPLVESKLLSGTETRATIATTAAVTILEGSLKENVLPRRARAVVNFRIHPEHSTKDVIQHVADIVKDPAVEITLLSGSEPSRISSHTSDAWHLLSSTIRRYFPDVAIIPGLVVGATDARHYEGIAENAYRFSPRIVTKEDLSRLHGIDERMAIGAYTAGIAFFTELIREAGATQWGDKGD